ncbi:MAG: hypothetical protein JNK74_24380 [Candidatus Hydrogenedentes bacterium]|nr:hypothetical protein [Candidatus Hydrogenedentota bacterium]
MNAPGNAAIRSTNRTTTAPRLCRPTALVLLISLLLPQAAFCFSPPVDTRGPLTARIEGPDAISETGVSVPVKLILSNSGTEPVQGTARCTVIDDWTVTPDIAQPFSLHANEELTLDFSVVAGPETLGALYPIHALIEARTGDTALQLHPILIVKAAVANPPVPARAIPWEALRIAPDSENELWYGALSRVIVHVTGEAPRIMPMGWRGTEPLSFGTALPEGEIHRGDPRVATTMHPPWRDGHTGTICTETPLALPDGGPIRLRFAVAIRDHDVARNEPASDGVTFRVRVLPFRSPDDAEGELLYEHHTAAKQWEESEVNLDAYAGQEVRLQFEVHPGPKNDPTCDQAYWAEPRLIVGTPKADDDALAPSRELGVIERNGAHYAVSVRPGARGLLDAKVTFTSKDNELSFTGFRAQALGTPLAKPHVRCPLSALREEPGAGYKVRHTFQSALGPFDLLGELRVEDGALKAQFQLENTPAPRPWEVVALEDVAAGPWSTAISRVYAGQGNVLVEPEAFTLEFDGHRLATSFVGFDFANGMAIVQASDAPPSRLEYAPETRTASLHVQDAQTVCYIPAGSAWEAALAWREIDPRKAAGGVANAAGRFAFDLWGGGYAEQRGNLQRAFDYGLTDAMVVWHNWQRWGYDYRLPDIWPPNPEMGTEAEFKALADLCRQRDVIFAPHDNYIDFYPDADHFSYDHIAFWQGGAPIAGWLNEGRGSQAYRWRPDRVRPFLEANLTQIRDGIGPTGFFIDVWSSMGPHAYWTRDGDYYTATETRQIWGDAFAWIREYLGNNAPQISESGHDQLIGWLDAAQTNHLRVDTEAKDWTTWRIACDDAERVPWMDAVHHDRFALHGAGYGNRYAGGLDPELHGIYSDDYIVTEVMTGHPAMVDNAFGWDVVRKYWLLQGLMRDLALRRIESVDFVEGDIHRQHIRWDNGADVWVNRGETDWVVENHQLPPFGFLARSPEGEAAIERIDGIITDWARDKDTLYVNARPDVSDRLTIAVKADAAPLNGEAFALTLHWSAGEATPAPMRIFVHFRDKNGAIQFQGDHDSPTATTEWKGAFDTFCTVRLPEGGRPGDTFDVRAGLYSAQNGTQARITGTRDSDRSVQLGALALIGAGTTVTGITWTPAAPDESEAPRLARLNPTGKPIRFGAVTTTGACKIARDTNGITVRPLPGSPAFTLRIDWPKLPWTLPLPAQVEAMGQEGQRLSLEAVQHEGDTLVLTCDPEAIEYRLVP